MSVHKKILAATVAGAFVIGTGATTFAAANPFSDVPAGHWAYQSVAKLAAEGIVEGYGDGTYRGDRNITRYEMAQMIAKAMAKNPSGASKAELDRLAAEFRDELNNLGVRVSELEKYADKVVWHGFLRYTYQSKRTEQASGRKSKDNSDRVKFRLEPVAEVNDHWTLRTRLDMDFDMNTDAGTTGDLTLVRAWAQGKYGDWTFNVGRMPLQLDTQFLFDDEFAGASISYGKKLKVTAQAGRWDLGSTNSTIRNAGLNVDKAANLQSVGVEYKGGGFSASASYHHLNSDGFANVANYKDHGTTDDANIWSVGLGYRFNDAVAISGNYAQNTKADRYDHAHNIQLDIYGAKKTKPGTWGLYAAYRRLGQYVALDPTYNANGGLDSGEKGLEVGAGYTLWKNVLLQAKYVNGKKIANSRDVEKLFGRVEFFF